MCYYLVINFKVVLQYELCLKGDEFKDDELSNTPHSQMEHYFFSYLLTWEVNLIEILKIMAQIWQYVIFLSLKPTKVTSDFILY